MAICTYPRSAPGICALSISGWPLVGSVTVVFASALASASKPCPCLEIIWVLRLEENLRARLIRKLGFKPADPERLVDVNFRLAAGVFEPLGQTRRLLLCRQAFANSGRGFRQSH